MSRDADRGWPVVVHSARQAWRGADFAAARDQAEQLVAAGEGGDHAQHVLVLARCALGDGVGAIAAHAALSPRYRHLAALDEPVLWAHLHSGDLTGAMAFARRRGLTRVASVAASLQLALDHPPEIVASGLVEVAFNDDPLTPFMPGLGGAVNGRPVVLRLDTGGAYLHVSQEFARMHGIEVAAREREFAALSWHWIGTGIADVELGPLRLRNMPVAVHEQGLPTGAMAAAFGVEMGPIIGTSLLRPFLATVDAPGARLLLSPRGRDELRARHLALLPGQRQAVPFGIVQDHRMIAAGTVGGTRVPLFIDSGLVAANPEQGQVSMLAAGRTLADWGADRPPRGRFAALPGPLVLGDARRDGLTALAVPSRTWRSLGHWDGVDVRALLSWGFLQHFCWTIDHDRQEFLLGPGPDPGLA